MLEDFLTATASMARKRHLASSARGFSCFCLMTHRKGIRPIRPIRGRTESRGQGLSMFIALAMDAKTQQGDGGAGGKYPSLLEDFQTDTASMARKRHLASTARGFLCFCPAPSIRKRIRSIRLIRGRIEYGFTADTGCSK